MDVLESAGSHRRWRVQGAGLQTYKGNVGVYREPDRRTLRLSHLQFGMSDAALITGSDAPNGELELRPHRKFATLACVCWLRLFMPRWWLGFQAGGCFWILSNRRWL